jgi:hypothetical protein
MDSSFNHPLVMMLEDHRLQLNAANFHGLYLQPSPLQMLAAQNQRKLPSELRSQVKKAKGGTWFDRTKRRIGI